MSERTEELLVKCKEALEVMERDLERERDRCHEAEEDRDRVEKENESLRSALRSMKGSSGSLCRRVPV